MLAGRSAPPLTRGPAFLQATISSPDPSVRSITASPFVVLLVTYGRGWPRWVPTGPDGTPTTLLITVGTPAPNVILPDLQNIHVGSVFPALPGVKDVFVVAQCEREHSLVLSWRLPNGQHQTTWAYILDEPQRGQTRLIVRGRVASGYRPFGLPEWFATRVGPVAHLVMQRKQLLGIARRAESSPRITEPPEAVR